MGQAGKSAYQYAVEGGFQGTEEEFRQKMSVDQLQAVAAAAAYDPEGSYAVGGYCTHDGKLHKCNTPIESGEAWNAAHWTETTVAAELIGFMSQLNTKIGAENGLNADTDLNCLFDAGFYYTNSSTTPTILNAPYNVAFSVYVIRSDTSNANRAMQIAFPLSASDESIKYRKYVSNEWTEWLPIPTATLPEETPLPLLSGVSPSTQHGGYKCVFRKNQFGEVYITLGVQGDFTNGQQLFTLPEGYRPAGNIVLPSYIDAILNGASSASFLRISNSGVGIVFTPFSTVNFKSVFCSGVFYASN